MAFSFFQGTLRDMLKKSRGKNLIIVPLYYVDDTKLLISFKIKESSKAFANLTDDLHRIGQWCSINNLLLLNPSKTEFMVLGRKYVLDWSLLSPLLWEENSFLNTPLKFSE